MRIAFALLAEAVEHDPDTQTFNLTGAGFDTIFAPSFPVRQDRMVVVFRVEASVVECDRAHTVRLELIDADGDWLGGTGDERFTPERHPVQRYRAAPYVFAVDFGGAVFPSAGNYSIHILVDDLEVAVLPLYLVAAGG